MKRKVISRIASHHIVSCCTVLYRVVQYLKGWRWKSFAGGSCHVVLQGVGEIIGVREEEILGEIDELEQA